MKISNEQMPELLRQFMATEPASDFPCSCCQQYHDAATSCNVLDLRRRVRVLEHELRDALAREVSRAK